MNSKLLRLAITLSIVACLAILILLYADRLVSLEKIAKQSNELEQLKEQNRRLSSFNQIALVQKRIDERKAGTPQDAERSELNHRAKPQQVDPSEMNLVKGMRSISELEVRGSTEPGHSIESIYVAYNNGDTQTVSNLISFTDETKSMLEGLRQSLSGDFADRFTSAEEMVAFYLGGAFPEIAGMQIVANSRSFSDRNDERAQNPDLASMEVQVQYLDGRVRHNSFTLEKNGDSWKWVIPNDLVHRVLVFSRLKGTEGKPKK